MSARRNIDVRRWETAETSTVLDVAASPTRHQVVTGGLPRLLFSNDYAQLVRHLSRRLEMWKLLSPDPFNDMRSQLQWMQIPEHNQALAFSLVSAATQQEPVFEFVWSDHGTEFRANLWNTAPLLSFCAQNGILDLLPLARALADKTFPGMVECDFEVQNDPESELAWVLLTVRTTGSPQEILRAYDAFARQWIGAVSSQKQGMLRLAYDVI